MTLLSTPAPVRRSNAGSAAAAPSCVRRCACTLASTAFATGCCRRQPGPAPSWEVTSTTAAWSPGGRRPRRAAGTPTPFSGRGLAAKANSILFLYRAVNGAGSVGGTRASSADASSGERAFASFFHRADEASPQTTFRGETFAVRRNTSSTCSRFMSSCAAYDTSCHVHPPHSAKCGHGDSTACGDGTEVRTLAASAKRPPPLTPVTRATTVSPGVARSHSSTNPDSRRHTPRPPNASAVHSTSTSSPTASGGAEEEDAEEEDAAARGEAAAAAVDGARIHRTNGLTLEPGRVEAPAPWSARDARATTRVEPA